MFPMLFIYLSFFPYPSTHSATHPLIHLLVHPPMHMCICLLVFPIYSSSFEPSPHFLPSLKSVGFPALPLVWFVHFEPPNPFPGLILSDFAQPFFYSVGQILA